MKTETESMSNLRMDTYLNNLNGKIIRKMVDLKLITMDEAMEMINDAAKEAGL